MVSAVVPAHNEERTVGDVVSALVASRCFRSVLVVDDGSKDRTSDVARRAGAEVLVLPKNRGKGGAMSAGVHHLGPAPVVAFFDSDLTGFRPEHAELLVSEFYRLRPAQLVGLRDHFGPMASAAQLMLPIMSGERIVQRWVLDRLPLDCWDGYAIETAMNFTVDRYGGLTALVPMRGVSIRNKTSKIGFVDGMLGNIRMLGKMADTKRALRTGGTCKIR